MFCSFVLRFRLVCFFAHQIFRVPVFDAHVKSHCFLRSWPRYHAGAHSTRRFKYIIAFTVVAWKAGTLCCHTRLRLGPCRLRKIQSCCHLFIFGASRKVKPATKKAPGHIPKDVQKWRHQDAQKSFYRSWRTVILQVRFYKSCTGACRKMLNIEQVRSLRDRMPSAFVVLLSTAKTSGKTAGCFNSG